MQIVIPLSGEGKRFKVAGYQELKPLIKVGNKPIIQYVVELFPMDSKFIFIVNQAHEEVFQLKELLKSLVPEAKVVAIPPHKKGPVWAVTQAYSEIDDAEEVIVNYCDFNMVWDFHGFIKDIRSNKAAGGILCYTGFHPHLRYKENLYATCSCNVEMTLIEIKEKHTFNELKLNDFHSTGTYYFQSGGLLKVYLNKFLETAIPINGEYYVSEVYNLLVNDGLKVKVNSDVSHFCQWGTPEDFEEFLQWEAVFKKLA